MKEFEFFIAANERCLASPQRFEATADPALSEDAERWHWRWQPFDHNLAEALVLEQAADQPPRVLRDHDFACTSDRLQPGSKVWRVPDHRLLLGSSRADQVTDHR